MTFLAVLDPAWKKDSGGGGRGAQNHYDLHDVDAMALAYQSSPPWRHVGNGLLWMWATEGSLSMPKHGAVPDAYRLVSALGFRVVCSWIWAKVDAVIYTEQGSIVALQKQPGIGQWSRKEHEHLLMCKRGKPRVPPPECRPRSVIYAKRGEHSAKPDEAWSVIETVSRASLGSDVVGCEWNARRRRAHWDAYGALDGEDMPLRWARAGETD